MIAISCALGRPVFSCLKPETNAAAALNSVPAANQAISASSLEKNYGVQIISIAVTAAGGMVEFRFRILDPKKAAQVLRDPDKLPVLMVGDRELSASAPQEMLRDIRMKKDAVCHILYPNARNAVKTGIPVSAVFGSVHVEPIKAQ